MNLEYINLNGFASGSVIKLLGRVISFTKLTFEKLDLIRFNFIRVSDMLPNQIEFVIKWSFD
jgi:hypothetical protein